MSVEPDAADQGDGFSPTPLTVLPSQNLVQAVNRFGFAMLNLASGSDELNGLCAFNVYHCLVMAAIGSQGETLGAFANVLGFDRGAVRELARNVAQLDRYCKTNKAVELSSASSVWHLSGLPLGREWQAIMNKDMQAKFGPLNADAINDFVARETRDKVQDVVSASGLADVVLMLITCLYFKATWEQPFVLSRTSQVPFHTFGGKAVTCPMMQQAGILHYAEDSTSQVCILPYVTEAAAGSALRPEWKAAVILPKSAGRGPMQELLARLAGSDGAVQQLLGMARARAQLSLGLPRFKLKLSMLLNERLSTLGLGPAFEASNDFEPLSAPGPLGIDTVDHAFWIEVNEHGTEMAAQTAVVMSRSRIPTSMWVDRPFIFLIFDQVTQLVLGSVVMSEISESE